MSLNSKFVPLLALCLAIILIGLITGATAVVLPPMAAFGVVGLMAIILIWAIPELRRVPEKSLRHAFFVTVSIQLCVPGYYAIQVPGLPWISVRRLSAFVLIFLFSIALAGSNAVRDNLLAAIKSSSGLAACAIGFFIMICLSVLTTTYFPTSVSQLVDCFLTWYVPFFASITILKSDDDIISIVKLICICSLVVGIIGISEFLLQHRFLFDLIPKSTLAKMMEDNPSIEIMVHANPYRNGLYRASSIFTVPLSFGEFEAMVAPFGAFFLLHAARWRGRVFGFIVLTCAVVSLFCSGARGGTIGFLIAMPILFILWLIRHSRANRFSIVGPIGFAVTFIGTAVTLGLVVFWGRLHNVVLGGGDTAASDNARLIQWELAKWHIAENPITGHGIAMGAYVIGYYTASPIPSVDSYILTLLVETGVPGFLFFFGMILGGIWSCAKSYLLDMHENAALSGPIACSLVAFGIYRTALSLHENHTLFFLVLGLIFLLNQVGSKCLSIGGRSIGANRQQGRKQPDKECTTYVSRTN